LGQVMDIPRLRLDATDTAELSRGERSWVDENRGIINSWEDFDRYPWPRPEDVDYSDLEYVGSHLPDGMKLIFQCEPGGQLELCMWLMGYEPFALTLADDPTLIEAISNKVGELLLNVFATAAEIPGVAALWLGDDMGFKTGTMVSPEALRRYVFPWQKQFAGVARAHSIPFLLHSCGNLTKVMPDLITDVRIDAKHSFEDVIEPVAEAKRHYGEHLALLGGLDMDYLCRATPEQVRGRTRELIDQCAPGGGWALGSGNTVANYVPIRNYLAMLDEGHKYGRYSH